MKHLQLLSCLVALFMCNLPCFAQSSPDLSLRAKAMQEIKEADRAFSRLSDEQGIAVAFLTYMADDGTLLRPKNDPLIGKDAIRSQFVGAGNEPGVLTWEPHTAEMSASGDLGYTSGTYRLNIVKPDGKKEAAFGTYVSIWKKQADGSWRVVLDTGNPGLTAPSKNTVFAFEQLQFIAGAWMSDKSKKQRSEQWARADEYTLRGQNVQLNKKDTSAVELLSIEMRGNEIYYILKLRQQPHPVFFRLVNRKENEWIFENSENKFPHRIRYNLESDRNLNITVEGHEGGKFRQEVIMLTRMTENK